MVQYAGNPLSLAISEAVLTVVEEEGLAAHAQELGAYIQSQLRAMATRHPCIGDVRSPKCTCITIPIVIHTMLLLNVWEFNVWGLTVLLSKQVL